MILSLFEKTGKIQASSLTRLYQVMVNELYNWHLRLDGQDSLEIKIDRDNQLARLGEIAKIGLQNGKLIIPHKLVQHLVDPVLLETGLLKKIEGEKIYYYFVHLSSQ
jgi:hypothetical protein